MSSASARSARLMRPSARTSATNSGVIIIGGRSSANLTKQPATALARSSCAPGRWSIESLPDRAVRRSRPQSSLTNWGSSRSETRPELINGNSDTYRSLFGRADCSHVMPTVRKASCNAIAFGDCTLAQIFFRHRHPLVRREIVATWVREAATNCGIQSICCRARYGSFFGERKKYLSGAAALALAGAALALRLQYS
jgi:hypothetical protein